ncbi:TULIP family P47-like protein [uncultured Massilia sp.]|uniref:TULIP family P47-like protein n=1 Tax=uncultured Massilia sp. TaxID=169973 RepID=UPI0025D13ABE|nr:TULIP family P47-like protein [uncultured Massilia sp.]
MDNYGWDVVYASSGNYINKRLVQEADKLITSFDYEDAVVRLTGTFGPWQIVPGGGGALLQFVTPIVHGTALFKTIDNATIPLDGAVPLVQMQLALPKGKSQAIMRSLVFNCTTAGKQKGDTTPGAVTVVSPDISGTLNKLPEAQREEAALGAALLATGLGRVFVANAAQLGFVFADVLPVPTGQNADWLTPVSCAYAYQEHDDDTLGGIAILGVLDNSPTDALPRDFDTRLLQGKDFGFVLSARSFMRNVILPSLPAAFRGNCQPVDLRLNQDNTIGLAEGFSLDAVRVGLIDYTPQVTDLRYEIDDASMRCYVATTTDITGLSQAYVTNSVTSNNPAVFDPGTRTLTFQNDPHMATTQDSHIPCWEKVIGGLTLGIMNVVIEAVSLAIENSAGNVTDAKTARALGMVAPGLVSWNGQGGITVDAGGLADNVYMQGSLA